ncbi:MAG: ABC transporter substrate-binding protein [Myxococcaceae bacterium]
MKRTLGMFLISTAALSACGPRADTGPTQTIALGAVIDRTGFNAEPSWADAIKLAERNANAGLNRLSGGAPFKFTITFADTANEPAIAVSRGTEMVRNGAKALITDTSQADLELNKLAYDADTTNDLNVPIECGGCTSGTINNPTYLDTANPPDLVAQAALRNGQKWNFRSIMSTKFISQILVNLMLQNSNGDANNDGKFKISYVGSDEVFGRGAVKDLRTYATNLHPSSVPIIEELYHPRDADPNSFNWSELAQRLTDNQTNGIGDGAPDVVVVANFAQQQAAFVKAYRQGGYVPRLLHYHTFRISSALQSLGSLGDGVEGVSHVLLDDGASGENFSVEYENRYGIPVVYRDAIYYDNAMTLLLATMIAIQGLPDPTQVTGAQIRDAMLKTSVGGGEVVRTGPEEFARAVELIQQGKAINYEGASSPMDFDANGNVVGRLAQYRAESGKFVDVKIYDCVKADTCPAVDTK